MVMQGSKKSQPEVEILVVDYNSHLVKEHAAQLVKVQEQFWQDYWKGL